MDIQNHYYGHSAALAAHAGLSRIRHINGLVQHGWTIDPPTLVHFGDFARIPRTARRLVWSHDARGWDPRSDPFETTAIGAPFLYLSALARDARAEGIERTVAFPVHDTRLARIAADDEAYARELAAREGPSLVCLHPEDLERAERLRAWTRHGHTVVSAGSRRDPLFLGRVLGLVRSAPRVVSNQLSTAVMYAAAEGTEVEISGPEVHFGALGTAPSQRMRDLWPEFFTAASTGERREVALGELGSRHLRDAPELRALLGWDRRRATPAFFHWAGAPVRKAGAVLGLVKRHGAVRDVAAGASPWEFLRHPLSHLPGALPALPDVGGALPPPRYQTPTTAAPET